MSEQAVRSVVDAYVSAAGAGNVEAYVSLFDEAPFWGASDREPVRSLDALRTAISGMFGRVDISPGFTVESVEVSGDMAACVIHDSGSMRPHGGQPRKLNLTELWVLRQRAGVWKISHLIWNSRGPLPD